jgi:hypothetical protein
MRLSPGGRVMGSKWVERSVARMLGAALIASALGWSTSASAQSCAPGETASPFAFTGGQQSVAVPANVYSATVHLSGAQGGAGKSGAGTVGGSPNSAGGAGGRGARVSGSLNVLPGDVLSVGVGGQGSLAVNPGGASGGSDGGNGGGATNLLLNGSQAAIAAGGGGGGNAGWSFSITVPGGAGGDSGGSGSAGGAAEGGSGPFGGGGGSTSAGGAAGAGCSAFPGTVGQANGNGGLARHFDGSFDGAGFGGGGGGGATVGYGGGGGGVGTTGCSPNWNGGGGGGAGGTSSTGSLSSATISNGAVSGNGSALICFIPDTTPPTVTAPANIMVANAPGQSFATVTYPPATATDDSGGAVTLAYSHPSGSNFSIGVTTVTVTGTDAANNEGSATFTVTVNDTEAPTLLQPTGISRLTDPGQPTATITFPTPVTSDNSGLAPTVTFTPPAGPFPIGFAVVTVRATDAAGNFAEDSFNVTVSDSEAPVITQPANIVQATDPGEPHAAVTFPAPVTSDNSGQAPIVTFTPPAGNYTIGTTQVTARATDGAANFAEATFSVTVNDTEPPVIVGPSDIVVDTAPGENGAFVSFSITSLTDNSGGTVDFVIAPDSGSFFTIGVTTVTITATDPSSNISTDSFTVTVNDNQAPDITQPADIVASNDPFQPTATITFPPLVTTDNSGQAPTVTFTPPAGAFAIGTTQVTARATDAAGLFREVTFNVTVNDTEAPVLNQPANILQSTDPGLATATIAFPALSTLDNSGQPPMVTFTPPEGSFPIGETSVTARSTDAAGNFAEATFTVTVADQETPVVTVPADIVAATTGGQSGATVFFPVQATDNSGTVDAVAVPPSGSFFPLGVTTVTITATDPSANSRSEIFTVTVNDADAPVFNNVPADIEVNTDAGQNFATVSWVEPTATDNDQVVIFTSSHNPGSQFALGVTTVSYTAIDAARNQSSASFTITVTDGEYPVFTNVPADISVDTDAGKDFATVSWTPPTVADNDGIASLTASHNPGEQFPIGTTRVTYTAIDFAGNLTCACFNVTVSDGEPPVISGVPDNISVDTDVGQAFATVSWTPPTATDNAGIASFTASHVPGQEFPIGVTTVTYNATDVTGHQTTASFTITVIENELPVIVGMPENIAADTDAGQDFATVTWAPPTATDNAPGVTLTSTHAPGDQFSIGMTLVSYTATDANANSVTESFEITVSDNEAPIIVNLPSDIMAETDAGQDFATVTWTAPTATDNAPGVTLTSTHAPGDQFPIGTTNVSYTATDANSNVTTGSFAVIVNDAQPPVFTTFPADIEVAVDFPATGQVASWTEPTASDNLPGVTVTQTAGPTSGSSFPIGVTTVSYEARDAAGGTVSDSFTVTVNQTPPGSVVFEFSGPAEGTYSVSSADPEFNFSLDSTGGLVSRTVEIRPGNYAFTYAVPDGNGVDSASCTSGGTIDPTDMQGELTVVSGGQITCSVTTLNSRDVATGMIGEFLQNRSALILENGPDVQRRLERLTGSYTNDGGVSALGFGIESAQLPFNLTLSDSDAKFSYSLRRSQAAGGPDRLIAGPVGAFDKSDRPDRGETANVLDERFGGRPGEIPGAPATGGPFSTGSAATGSASMASAPAAFGYGGGSAQVDPMQNRFDIWVEGRMAAFNSKAGDGKFGIVHAGMDYLFTPSILAGIGVQVDWTSQEGAAAGSEISGTGYMVGPYMTAKLTDAFYFDARAAWGQSFNQISPFGTFEDEFDAQRWLVTAAVIGQYNLTEAWKVRPELRLSYFKETSDPYTDSLGVVIPSVSVETGTLEFGPTFTTELHLDNGFVFAPFFTVEGIWTFFQENTATVVSSQPGLAEEGVRAKGEIGGTLTNGNGVSLSGSLSYDGIGSDDYEAWGGKLRLGVTF